MLVGINCLGEDLLLKCLLLCDDVIDIVSFSCTSKYASQVCQSEYLWRCICGRYSAYDYTSTVCTRLDTEHVLHMFPSTAANSWRRLYRNVLFPYGSMLGYWWLGPRQASLHIDRFTFPHPIPPSQQPPISRGLLLEVAISEDTIIAHYLFSLPSTSHSRLSGNRAANTDRFLIERVQAFMVDTTKNSGTQWTMYGISPEDFRLEAMATGGLVDGRIKFEEPRSRGDRNLLMTRYLETKLFPLDTGFHVENILFKLLRNIERDSNAFGVELSGLQSLIRFNSIQVRSAYSNYIRSHYARAPDVPLNHQTYSSTTFLCRLPVSKFTDSYYRWQRHQSIRPVESLESKTDIDLIDALQGLWIGDYGVHGGEFLLFCHSADSVGWIKVTGDNNVPSGVVSLLTASTNLKLGIGVDFAGFLQTSASDYSSPQVEDVMIRLLSVDRLSFYWAEYDIRLSYSKFME